MIKIGITGSIASGKTTASRIIANRRGPIFNADKIVKKLYENRSFKSIISKRFKLTQKKYFKKILKDKILERRENLKILEKIIHPLVRKAMINFFNKNKNKKLLFLEIPLLIESKLAKYFDLIIYIKSKKNLRLARYTQRGGNKYLFTLLDDQQLSDSKKTKFCDYVVVNNKSLTILKKKLFNIIKEYE